MTFTSSNPTLAATFDNDSFSLEWTTLTPANNGEVIAPGRYETEATAPFGFLLEYSPGAEWLINGRGQEDDNPVLIGDATDTFSFHNQATDTEDSGPGPLRFNATQEIRLIASPTVTNSYRVVVETGGGGGPTLTIQPEQSADFVAEVGNEYPVDISALPAGGILRVTQPVGTASTDDQFAVFDSRLASDNGIDAPGLNRTIRIEFSDNLHSLPGPDFAVINSAGARIVFTYADATIGWRIASNVNN